MPVKPCIKVNGLYFSYQDNEDILSDINFTIASGDYVALVGPNGSGKTTLVKLMLNVLKPTKGTITIFGKPNSDPSVRARIGYVPQRITADPYFPASVLEIVQSGRTAVRGLFRRMTAQDRKAVQTALEITQTANLRDRLFSHLSGGQRQRVLIARALAAEPSVLILDEPTVGIDHAAQVTFYAFLRGLNKERGITIMIVSHDLEIVTEQVEKVLCINRELICHTTADEFVSGPYLEQLYGKQVRIIHHHHPH